MVGGSNPTVTTGDYLFFPSLFGVNYHLMSPVHTSPPSCNGNLAFICWGANSTDCSHISALAQVGLWVPTPDAERSSQSSCELLARLQEFASTGSSACLVHKQPGFARCA